MVPFGFYSLCRGNGSIIIRIEKPEGKYIINIR